MKKRNLFPLASCLFLIAGCATPIFTIEADVTGHGSLPRPGSAALVLAPGSPAAAPALPAMAAALHSNGIAFASESPVQLHVTTSVDDGQFHTYKIPTPEMGAHGKPGYFTAWHMIFSRAIKVNAMENNAHIATRELISRGESAQIDITIPVLAQIIMHDLLDNTWGIENRYQVDCYDGRVPDMSSALKTFAVEDMTCVLRNWSRSIFRSAL